MNASLTFQSTVFETITRNDEPWIRGSQIASALGYAQPERITELYTRHADEFTDSMTAVIKLMTTGGPQETRIFSLRGCHLLAMFARTSVAKAFRRWVLDVLDTMGKAEQRLSTRSDAERKELTAAINAWVGCAPVHYAAARNIVNAHFGVKSVDELTVAQVREAVALVHAKIAEAAQAQKSLPEPPKPALEQEISRRIAITKYYATQLRTEEELLFLTLREQCWPDARKVNTPGTVDHALVPLWETIGGLAHALEKTLDAIQAHALAIVRVKGL
jgi:prophage antirepressor-like protein